jgi:hypothetical protein
LTDDLTGSRAIFFKGWLFLILGVFAGGTLIAMNPTFQYSALLAITVWAFCRWYFFMFYVVEHYVDSGYRFASIGSFLRYLWRRRTGSSG